MKSSSWWFELIHQSYRIRWKNKMFKCTLHLILSWKHLRKGFNFWNVHGIMNTSGLLQSTWGFTYFAWDPKWSIHDSMNIPKIGGFTYFARDLKYSWFHEHSKNWGLHLLCKRPEVFMIPWTDQKLNLFFIFTFYYQYLKYKKIFLIEELKQFYI